MQFKVRELLLLIGLACSSGCFSPWNFRLPTVWNQPPDIERQEYQYHDPFPDNQVGPSTSSRPLFYTEQRPLPVRIREKYDGTRVRTPVGGALPPPAGASPGSEYPQVVPF